MTSPSGPVPDPAAAFTQQRGVVTSYDDHAGLGTITDAASGFVWPFHCTHIADGSRTIDVGRSVGFRVEPRPTGLEAVDVATDDEPG